MSRFKTELIKIIDEEIESSIKVLTNTGAIKTLDDYKYHVGGLDKLRRMANLIEDAEKKSEER